MIGCSIVQQPVFFVSLAVHIHCKGTFPCGFHHSDILLQRVGHKKERNEIWELKWFIIRFKAAFINPSTCWPIASRCTLNYSVKIRGGNQIWIFKPQVNFDVIPTYKHGGKIIFRFWDHLNPPHLRWSFRFFGDFRPFQRNFYIFINAGLEPKLFEIKSSTQQQSCKAHKIGQFCHQDQPSICLCSRVTDRATTAFHLAPKW